MDFVNFIVLMIILRVIIVFIGVFVILWLLIRKLLPPLVELMSAFFDWSGQTEKRRTIRNKVVKESLHVALHPLKDREDTLGEAARRAKKILDDI
jgi:hypothetical protein